MFKRYILAFILCIPLLGIFEGVNPVSASDVTTRYVEGTKSQLVISKVWQMGYHSRTYVHWFQRDSGYFLAEGDASRQMMARHALDPWYARGNYPVKTDFDIHLDYATYGPSPANKWTRYADSAEIDFNKVARSSYNLIDEESERNENITRFWMTGDKIMMRTRTGGDPTYCEESSLLLPYPDTKWPYANSNYKKIECKYPLDFQLFFEGAVQESKVIGVSIAKNKLTIGESTKAKAGISTRPGADLAMGSPVDVTANAQTTWTSDKSSVATVDAYGQVKGISAGTAKICANWERAVEYYPSISWDLTDCVTVTVADGGDLLLTSDEVCYNPKKDSSTSIVVMLKRDGEYINVSSHSGTTISIKSGSGVASLSGTKVTAKKAGTVTLQVKFQSTTGGNPITMDHTINIADCSDGEEEKEGELQLIVESPNVCYGDGGTNTGSFRVTRVNEEGKSFSINMLANYKIVSGDAIKMTNNRVTAVGVGTVVVEVSYTRNGVAYPTKTVTLKVTDCSDPQPPGGNPGDPDPPGGEPPGGNPGNPPPPPPMPSGDTKTETVHHPPSWGVGYIDWGLHVDAATPQGATPTKMSATNALPIGSHHAQKPEIYKIGGILNGSRNVTVQPPVKGVITYKVEYDYTDYEDIHYVCVAYQPIIDGEGNLVGWGPCISWQETGREPNWSRGKTFTCELTLNADHNYNDTFRVNSSQGDFLKVMKLGQKDTVQAFEGGCNVVGTQTHSETVSRQVPEAEIALETQTYIPLHENNYNWDATGVFYGNLPAVFPYVKVDKQGEVSVPDLDAAYKEQYRNAGGFVTGNFSIPLDPEVTGKSMALYGQEAFMLARSTGFTYPVKRTASEAVKTDTVRAAYEAYTGEKLDLTTNPAAHEKLYHHVNPHDLSRYYLPIDPNKEGNPEYMTPKTVYSMEQGVRNLGINNIHVIVDQRFSFDKYLVGSVFDTDATVFAKVVEQKETPFEDISYSYSTTMSVDESKSIHDKTNDRNKFVFGYKMADTNKGFLEVASVKPKAADLLPTPFPVITDVAAENERIK